MKESKDVINAVVTGVYPDKIHIEVLNIDSFKVAGEKLSVGAYLRISDSEDCAIIAVVQSFSIQKSVEDEERRYVIDGTPIGFIDADGKFSRGGNKIAIPPIGVEPASRHTIQKIYAWVESAKSFEFSSLAQDSTIRVPLDGDRFFNKHIAIVGSTGCGKSCSVATVLRKATEAKEGTYQGLNNSHIIIFDLHGEYSDAFPAANHLSINNLLTVQQFHRDEVDEPGRPKLCQAPTAGHAWPPNGYFANSRIGRSYTHWGCGCNAVTGTD